MGGWFSAWWDQIRRRPQADPWNDDPEITRERDRQHETGVTDAAQAYRLRREIRDRYNERLRQSWEQRH